MMMIFDYSARILKIASLMAPVMALLVAPAQADLILSVGNIRLRPDTANQEIPILATFSSSGLSALRDVGGLQLNVRIGDGTGSPGTAPVFQGASAANSQAGVRFDGTIWDGVAVDIAGNAPLDGFAQYASMGISFVANSNLRTLDANSKLVGRLLIDTTGVSSGTFAIALDDADLGASYFQSITDDPLVSAMRFSNGTLTVAVPEPSMMGLLASVLILFVGNRRIRYAKLRIQYLA